jgi:hypothetical protein
VLVVVARWMPTRVELVEAGRQDLVDLIQVREQENTRKRGGGGGGARQQGGPAESVMVLFVKFAGHV